MSNGTSSLKTNLSLDDIVDDDARKKIKRHLNAKRRKAKLSGKVAVWGRKKLERGKGIGRSGGLAKPPGPQLKGTEAKPGVLEKPYLEKQADKFEKGKISDHIAGSPVVICKLAEQADASSQKHYVNYVIDQKTARPEYAVGRITGAHSGRGKGSLPTMLGGMESGDHKGHGIPEAGVQDPL